MCSLSSICAKSLLGNFLNLTIAIIIDLSSLQIQEKFCFCFMSFSHEAWGILAPWQGIELTALKGKV